MSPNLSIVATFLRIVLLSSLSKSIQMIVFHPSFQNYILLLRVNCYVQRQVNCCVPLGLIVKSRVDICCGIFIARVFEIPTWLLYLRWWIVVLSSVSPRYLIVRESNHHSLACQATNSYSSHHSQESCWVVDCYVIMCQCSTWLPSYFWPKGQNFIAIVWPIPSVLFRVQT